VRQVVLKGGGGGKVRSSALIYEGKILEAIRGKKASSKKDITLILWGRKKKRGGN